MREWMYRSTFLFISALAGLSHPGYFTPRERAPGILWIGGWVNPRTGLKDIKK
jgi:hypothetical protein